MNGTVQHRHAATTAEQRLQSAHLRSRSRQTDVSHYSQFAHERRSTLKAAMTIFIGGALLVGGLAGWTVLSLSWSTR